MGFARVGNTQGALNTTANTTLGGVGQPLGASAAAGRVIVVAIAKDNTSTTGADNAEVTSVVLRNTGDTTTKLTLTKLKERTNAGTAATTATASLWWGILPVGVLTTDFIKATFAAATATKGLIGEIFSVGAGSTVAADPQTNAAEHDGVALASIAITPSNTSGPATNGRLVIRASAVENNAAAWTTATSGWTSFSQALFTSTGGAAANMSVGAEYKIGAGNNATDVYTSAPTGSAAADAASVIGALYEVPGPALEQTAFRFYGPGAENAQPALAAQNVNLSYNPATYPDTHLNLRVMVDETNGAASPSTYYQLEMMANASSIWFPVDVPAGGTNPSLFDAPLTTNGQATTNQLTGGTGAFSAGVVLELSSGNLAIPAGGFTELLWPLSINALGLVDGDFFDFRVTRGGVVLDTYTASPRITVSIPTSGSTGKIKAWTGSAWAEKPVKVWNGSAWVEKPLKVWNGSAWVLA